MKTIMSATKFEYPFLGNEISRSNMTELAYTTNLHPNFEF